MKRVLFATFDMEVGGVERSLINLLDNFNYEDYQVNLMLYKHQGDFLNLIPGQVQLLPEDPFYTTFRKSLREIIRGRQYGIAFTRLLSKFFTEVRGKLNSANEPGYVQMQLMWKYALPLLPKISNKYDVAISYLWPHYFVAEKVNADIKIAWIHTDFSTIETNETMDIKMWMNFNYIVAVSEECKRAFIRKYPILKRKVTVIENITAPEIIRNLASEEVGNPMKQDSRFKIVTVARFSHAKGIDNAAKALKLLKERGYEDIAWYVVGYGGQKDMIKQLITDYELDDCFYLLGKKTNPYPYMKEADLYVQPSRYEGKAVTVGEAQILAKPVLITNYPTARSQVNDGVDGMICQLSVEGIADGVEKLYLDENLRGDLIKNCQDTNYYNLEGIEKLNNIIDGLPRVGILNNERKG